MKRHFLQYTVTPGTDVALALSTILAHTSFGSAWPNTTVNAALRGGHARSPNEHTMHLAMALEVNLRWQ
tara:strand:- start:28886 stop:29092 length:207 start_codon:yes stop_codon:yes gene_type:complete